MSFVSFEIASLVRAMVSAQTAPVDAQENGSEWPVETERERATTAVARLLVNFEAATIRSDFYGEVAPYNDNRKAVWAWAQVIEQEAPWSALKDAAQQTREAAEALGWDRLPVNSSVEAYWQTE